MLIFLNCFLAHEKQARRWSTERPQSQAKVLLVTDCMCRVKMQLPTRHKVGSVSAEDDSGRQAGIIPCHLLSCISNCKGTEELVCNSSLSQTSGFSKASLLSDCSRVSLLGRKVQFAMESTPFRLIPCVHVSSCQACLALGPQRSCYESCRPSIDHMGHLQYLTLQLA